MALKLVEVSLVKEGKVKIRDTSELAGVKLKSRSRGKNQLLRREMEEVKRL